MKYLPLIQSPEDLKQLPPEALAPLCLEVRDFLIASISITGGHLASNLGVVELTTALHYCFDSPRDKIIWDVGHQAYVHKIFTGRQDLFPTLRMLDGLSGFPKRSESSHDMLDTGHSSTSISAALGMCVSRDLSGENYHVVSVIGDGSISNGLAFEALNCAGRTNTDMIVILNDNQMSISENVGAMARHLNEMRTAPSYLDVKADVHHILDKIPYIGKKLKRFMEKSKNALRYLLVPGAMFEELGFTYIGPIDGHNLNDLISVFNKAKLIAGPVILHVYTKKGKGYEQAEVAPDRYHGVDSFCVETGEPVQTKLWDTYSDVFGKEMTAIAGENEKLVAITAAMPIGTGLSAFQKKYPDRLFDVGISESHAVTFAAGMALNGYIPVFVVYSTFLQRSYDQIVHDVCLQNLHVVFAVDRAGIVGSDGETHQGIYDLSFLSHIPNLTMMAPKNKNELRQMLRFAMETDGPVAIRYPRGSASRVLKELQSPIVHGKAEIVAEGEITAILSVGSMMDTAYEVFQRLRRDGLKPALIHWRFIKPVDGEAIEKLRDYSYVFILEDNIVSGGAGGKILEEMARRNVDVRHVELLGLPEKFIEQGSRDELFRRYGLDPESVYQKIKGASAYVDGRRST